MGVIECKEILEDRTGGWNRLWQRTYKRSFRVECSSRYDGPYQIRLSGVVPGIGTRYFVSPTEFDDGSFVESHEYKCEHAGPNPEGSTWVVGVSYSPYDSSTFGSDPTLWPIRVSYGSKDYEKLVEVDQDGNAIRNSAGDRFETPVTVDDGRDLITVTRNEPVSTFDPSLPRLYRNTVNKSPWNGFETHAVKCNSVVTSDPQYDSNNRVWYYTVTYVFEAMYLDPDQSPQGWAKYILDQGYMQIDVDDDGFGYTDPTFTKTKILTEKGEPITDPALLDGNGQRLGTGDDPVFLNFNVYRESEFNDLNLDLSRALGRL
jgi:hypothetical protein